MDNKINSERKIKNELLVKVMDEVVEENGCEPETDRQWQKIYEIACERLIRDRINNH